MKTALFVNFTEETFTGYWDGKPKKFEPGQSVYMPDYLANHFAKHLVNRELLRKDRSGNLLYPDGEKFTSPKKPEDAPLFMELFNKAYIPDDEEDMGSTNDDIDALIKVANKNRKNPQQPTSSNSPVLSDQEKPKPSTNQNPNEPQIIVSPDFDDDDEDDDAEESFKGKPVDENSTNSQ